MRFFLFLCVALSNISCDLFAAEEPPARPNIIFIVADDMGPWAWGGGGDPQARTPHLDRLAREGARLDHCYSPTPVCSPSRVAVLVSRYGTEVGITDWINPKSEPTIGLDPKYPAWPTFLNHAGYRTAMIGKWHLGTEDRFLPKHFGYDHFVGHRSSPLELRDPLLDVDNHTERRSGFVADVFTDEAIRFMRKDLHKPFAISLHFREPHRPWLPLSAEDYKPFEKLDSALPQPQHPLLDVAQVKKIMPEYLAAVACIDRNVGRLVAALDQDKLTDNTLFIFTSDHGYNVGHHGILHKGNGEWLLTSVPPSTNPNIPAKRAPNLLDNSLRVPAIVRFPKKIPAGLIVNRTITHLDWFPTLLAATDVPLPANTGIHGRNAWPLLQGKDLPNWDDTMYIQYSHHHDIRTDMRALRTPRWKLVRDFLNPGRDGLFDLQQDPHEARNLIAESTPEIQAAKKMLEEALLLRMKEIQDPALPGHAKVN